MMISFDEFGALRLSMFVADEELTALDDWEFQEHLWVGEALGFSEWLRLADDPDVLRSMAIDFATFPAVAADAVLTTIKLPLQSGMSLEQLDSLFGSRISERQFRWDRLTCDYITPEPHQYRVSCTVLNDGGLCYLVVMVPPIGDEV